MFNFLNEIGSFNELPLSSVITHYKYVNIGGQLLYVQGYKDVLSFETDKIVLKLKENELKIVGTDLNIKELNLNSITITGHIFLVEEMGGKNV